ncbi:LCP family protein [Dubosiella muris]|uniref:LytR family transcriptional regulator n=1 Tax=Dubosiella muris TaxID=3038133 RepID=A0AC61R6H2_9FIRM|nr:LCP family protein [Dubosiella muris]TGY65611.1 LytR family transcriptional regulator [Dubosiella muris]
MVRVKKIIIGILAVLVLLNLAVVGGLWYLRSKGSESIRSENQTNREGYYVNYQGKEYKYNDDMINILLLGIDKKGNIEDEVQGIQGLADTIILVSLDTTNNNLYMTAIPRDTMVEIRQTDVEGNFVQTTQDKLTLQYGYGKDARESNELMAKTVSNLMRNLPIQRYCTINLDAIPILNDTIGGVDVTALETVQTSSGTVYFTEGELVHLMGDDARKYIQIRDVNQIGSAMGRLNRQKQYINAFYSQAVQAVKKDLGLPLGLYNALQPYMYTNLTLEDVTYLGTEMLNMHFNPEQLTQIPGEAVFDENYHGGRTVFRVDEDGLQKWIMDTYYTEVTPEEEEQ